MQAFDVVVVGLFVQSALSTYVVVVCSSRRWRGSSGWGIPLLAYYSAPLKPSGTGNGRSESANLTMPRYRQQAIDQLGQIYPAPLGFLKQPTDSGSTCLGIHSTTSGKKMQNAMTAKNTT